MRWPGLALALALLLAAAGSAQAQISAQRIVARAITTAGADCTTATTCVVLSDVFRTGGGSIDVASSSPATIFSVQFEGSVDCATWRPLLATPLAGVSLLVPAVTWTSGPGAWTWTAGLCALRVRASTLSSGTLSVSIIAR